MPAPSLGFRLLTLAAAASAWALVAIGGVVCGREWPACNGAFVAGGSDAAVQVAHRTLAYVVAALALALAAGALRGSGPRLAGSLPLAAVLVQLGFGIALVLSGEGSGAHDSLAGLHVAGAGVVWALLVALVGLPRAQERALAPRSPAPVLEASTGAR